MLVRMDKRALAGVIFVVAAGAVIWAALFLDLTPGTSSPTASTTPPSETPTQTGSSAADFMTLPTIALPQGAVAVDDYFYTYQGAVYLKSVQHATSSPMQNIHASSFKRLTDFTTVQNPAINLDCGDTGRYAFYGDESQLFFYQIWVNPVFKRSKLEGVSGAKPADLRVVSSSSFQAGARTYDIGYEVGTSTCNYVIKLRN